MLAAYILKRVAWIFFVIFVVVTITYVLTMVIPANPALLWAGPHATKEQIEKAAKYLGLDKPPFERYLMYWRRFLTGDWGLSIHTKRPVLADLAKRIPATMELGLSAMIIAIALGVPLGILCGVRYETWVDHVLRIFSLAGVALPTFWLAIMMQLVFSYWLGILPSTGRIDPGLAPKTITGFYIIDSILTNNIPALISSLKHLVLPALALATGPLAIIVRVTRAAVLDVLSREHVKTLLVYGMPRRVILMKYIAKSAGLPVVTVIGLEFGYVLAGDFVVELVFDWPGLGRYAAEACLTLDYPAIMGTVIVVAIIYVVVNTLVDIVYAFLDPRIRY